MQLISSSYRLNTVMHHFRFHNDWSNNGQNGNIITGDKNTLVHQRSYCPTKISLKELLKLWSKGAKVKEPLKFHKYFRVPYEATLRLLVPFVHIHHESLIFIHVNKLCWQYRLRTCFWVKRYSDSKKVLCWFIRVTLGRIY